MAVKEISFQSVALLSIRLTQDEFWRLLNDSILEADNLDDAIVIFNTQKTDHIWQLHRILNNLNSSQVQIILGVDANFCSGWSETCFLENLKRQSFSYKLFSLPFPKRQILIHHGISLD